MRILTLSDIHFKSTYSDHQFEKKQDVISKYFKSFREKLNELNEEKEIDVVIIGGDIAFSGDVNQYSGIKKILKKCIPEKIPIFSIVGNHEVNWTELSAAIGSEVELTKLFTIPKTSVIDGKKFQRIFSNYYNSFQSELNDEREFEFEYQFCNKQYVGYIFSEKNNTLILLLNSAWYSYGPGVVEEFFKQWAKPKDRDSLIAGLPDLLGDTLSQEGKQSYFFEYYPFFEKINRLITEKADLKVVTFAHHPPSWLRWEELYADTPHRNFNTLIDFSNILITGHLHNPVLEPNLIRGKCYHVNNGIFLDYHFVDKHLKDPGQDNNPKNVFPNNWFNIIEVNDDNFELIPYKFTSVKMGGKGVQYKYDWIKEDRVNKLYDYPKIDDHKADVKENVAKKSKKGEAVITTYQPKKVQELIELLFKQRSNKFKIQEGQNKSIKQGEIVNLKGQREDYLVILNGLDEMQRIIQEAGSDYGKLKENELFSSLLDRLEISKIGDLPVVAFYEIVNQVSDNELFESFYQQKTIIYQSFKYSFFSSFQELHKFNELNIVFDAIVN
ncbi:3',5'-cyclic adenosine monophosphate phosphodiesterase CpdA [compost metagenome]